MIYTNLCIVRNIQDNSVDNVAETDKINDEEVWDSIRIKSNMSIDIASLKSKSIEIVDSMHKNAAASAYENSSKGKILCKETLNNVLDILKVQSIIWIGARIHKMLESDYINDQNQHLRQLNQLIF